MPLWPLAFSGGKETGRFVYHDSQMVKGSAKAERFIMFSSPTHIDEIRIFMSYKGSTFDAVLELRVPADVRWEPAEKQE